RERFGLARAGIERAHQLRAQALTQRMLGNQRLELRDQLVVAPGGELGLDPLFESGQPQLLEALDVQPGKRLELQIGQRPAAPQPTRLPDASDRATGTER